jgi:hypothetical protein
MNESHLNRGMNQVWSTKSEKCKLCESMAPELLYTHLQTFNDIMNIHLKLFLFNYLNWTLYVVSPLSCHPGECKFDYYSGLEGHLHYLLFSFARLYKELIAEDLLSQLQVLLVNTRTLNHKHKKWKFIREVVRLTFDLFFFFHLARSLALICVVALRKTVLNLSCFA